MKKLLAILFTLTLLNINPALAQQYVSNVMSIDTNHDNKITPESIANGTDDILLRKSTKLEVQKYPKDSYFIDDKNNYYLPLTFSDLRKSDSNNDRKINNKDPMFAGLYIGRLGVNANHTKKLVAVLPIEKAGITEIILPASVPSPSETTTPLAAAAKDGSSILVQAVPLR